LPLDLVPVAQRVSELEPVILAHCRQLVDQRSWRPHPHPRRFSSGPDPLTSRDFVFLDFEGDANLPVSERRIKRSPLRDVARMLRSFHQRGVCGISLAGGSRHHRPREPAEI